MGVIGLTNTQRNAKNTKNVPHFNNTMRPGAKASSTTNCETSYPTVRSSSATASTATSLPWVTAPAPAAAA